MDWDDTKSILKALALLYELQTPEEQQAQTTVLDNSVGFNAIDAGFLSSVAHQMLKEGKGVSTRQFSIVKSKIQKYHAQIEEYDLDYVELPETAVLYESRDDFADEHAGLIYVDKDRLLFEPYIYPTTQVKAIGFRWAQDDSASWESPLTLSAFEQLREMFQNCIISDSVTTWLEEVDKPVQLSDEVYKSELLAFQREAVGFMVKAERGLLGLAPGLGKTPISILAIKELGGRTLIICPLPLLYNWKREIKTWANEDAEIWHKGIGDDVELWVITNYETALRYMVKYDIKTITKDGKVKKTKVNWRPIEKFDFDNLIIDESVLIKNRKTQRSKTIYTLANKIKKIKHVYLLSGSPVTKFLDDMWHQFHVLDRKRFPSYWTFTKNYCVLEETYWGISLIANKEKAAQRIKQEYRDIYFARTQDQVLDLPDWIFDTLEIPMHPQQAKLYREMQNDFVATLPDGDKIVAPNILAQMIRLIQFASNPALIGGPDLHPKWSTVVDLLEFEELPAIVWTNFIKTAEMIEQFLSKKKYKVGMLIGKTKDTVRDDIVQDFQRGLLDVIVAHPAVGKFGLTLTAAKTAIYVERSYNGDDYYQSLHRVRRFGTTHSPHVIILLSNDVRVVDGESEEKPTIDHVIHKVLGFKRDNSIQITTGVIRDVLGV